MRRSIHPLAILMMVTGALTTASAQMPETRPATAPTTQPARRELPPDVLAALDGIQDFAFNFDQPGFYAVLRHVKTGGQSPGMTESPLVVKDWRELLERPGEFRGRPVTIEGLVGANKDPYTLQRFPELGQVTQLELRAADQPFACTAIFTQPAPDLPVGAEIRVTGYFVMVRQYHGPSGRPQPAALLVAAGPSAVLRKVAPPEPVLDWRWMVAMVVAALVITFAVLRWAGRSGRRRTVLRAPHAAPVSLADDLATWAEDERPGAGADDPDQHGNQAP